MFFALLLALAASPPSDDQVRFSLAVAGGAGLTLPPSAGGRLGVFATARWQHLQLRTGASAYADAGFARGLGSGLIAMPTVDVAAGWAWDPTDRIELAVAGGVEGGVAFTSVEDGATPYSPTPLVGALGIFSASLDVVEGWTVGVEARAFVSALVAPSVSVTTAITF